MKNKALLIVLIFLLLLPFGVLAESGGGAFGGRVYSENECNEIADQKVSEAEKLYEDYFNNILLIGLIYIVLISILGLIFVGMQLQKIKECGFKSWWRKLNYNEMILRVSNVFSILLFTLYSCLTISTAITAERYVHAGILIIIEIMLFSSMVYTLFFWKYENENNKSRCG